MRGFAKAHDAERAPLAHGNLVGIHLKDALLGEFLLQVERDHHLRQLALEGLFRSQEKPARQLHGERRSALSAMTVQDVGHGRLDQPVVVHPAVLKEAAVFDGDDRVDQVFRQLVERDELPLGAILTFEECRHQLRLELIGVERFAATADLADFAPGEANCGVFRSVKRLRAG